MKTLNRKILTLLLACFIPHSLQAQVACDNESALATIYEGIATATCLLSLRTPSFLDSGASQVMCGLLQANFGIGITIGSKLPIMRETLFDTSVGNNKRGAKAMKATVEMFRDFPTGTIGRMEYDSARRALELMEMFPKHDVTIAKSLGSSGYYAAKGARKSVGAASRLLTKLGVAATGAGGLGVALGAGLFVAEAALGAPPVGCGSMRGDRWRDFDSSCRRRREIGPNSAQFLDLPKREQIKIMNENPGLCASFKDLADEMDRKIGVLFKPDISSHTCKNGRPEDLELKWKDGNTTKAKILPSGDIQFDSETDKTKKYLVDLSYLTKEKKVSNITQIRVSKVGFAPRLISSASILKNQGRALSLSDKNDYALGRRLAFVVDSIQKNSPICSKQVNEAPASDSTTDSIETSN